MKKKTQSITSISLGLTTVSSIVLALHFYSTTEDLKQSQHQLNEKYNRVLVTNEDLLDTNIQLKDESRKVSGLLEQSQMEIAKLQKETVSLKNQSRQREQELTDEIARLKKNKERQRLDRQKVTEVSYKGPTVSAASATADNGEGWNTFRLTYYDNSYESTGKSPGQYGYGVTASGRQTQSGVTIAVDPNVIPLGSWVLIKWPNGRIEKRRADDTGGAIKGNDVDYYVPNVTSSMGVDHVQVKVIH